MDKYHILNISNNTLKKYKECFDKNGSPKSEEKIKWQFLKGPIDEQYVDIAIDSDNGKVAAIYAVSSVLFQINGKDFLGSQSLDTITDSQYRGKGLFVNLAKDVYRKSVLGDVKLVYGFPNGNSVYGFEKKLEWKILDPVPFLIKPLRTGYFVKKSKKLSWFPNFKIAFTSSIDKSIRFQINNEFPNEVDRIWGIFSKNISISVKRDKKYLDWRYIQKPEEDYRVVHAYTLEGNYIGFIVYCIKMKHGGKIAYIMEYIYDTAYDSQSRNLLKFAVNQILEEDADCILAWCLEHSENYLHFRKTRFFTLSEKFRPIELHFGVRSFDEKYDEIVNNRKNWYLSYSDSDTV